jgi:IS30 family transposase
MTLQRRPGLSSSEKSAVWERWRRGESQTEIARSINRANTQVGRVLRAGGGIVRPPRRRSRLALSLSEREEISRGLASGDSMRRIARGLGRSPSTVSREIARHGGRGLYRASSAEEGASRLGRRPKRCRLTTHRRLRRIVATKLSMEWSPQQISAWLKREYPDDEGMHISHETIYRSLFIQARGVLKKELLCHLRTRRVMRRSKRASPRGQFSRIIDAISISERPAEVQDRAVPGHWEGDLILGTRQSYVATLVERQSRFTMLVKVNGKDSPTVVKALIKQVQHLPAELRKTLTWDRGLEMARHKEFTIATGVDVYFCDPQSPWQRGTNDNTNRLLRQYLPKGTNLSTHSQAHLNLIAHRLNGRPRKTLDFMTPAEKLTEVLH